MKKKFRASFTIEMTYIIFFVFLGIAFIIGYSMDKHTEVVNSVEMHLLLERIAHDEKNIGYDKERLRSSLELKGGEIIGVSEKKFSVEGEMGEKSIRVAIYNPEGYIRATTALEGIYERLKGQLSEKSEK
ncbi:hypothetical protein [Lachnoanaerobaculum umeaense]|jgi:hypothetical protein|uniref:Uncharacterized protein n=1 Tax=Lachnoanaerobaculum umeaense TaxID=617123 RepID=A0A385PX85_9FIRM|nr:hypothetical protein [Lachnoanaerobaculum umeaense]AYA98586.1 hypothetical protein D4A81_00780 [Lachnoanaerobaculum umeaense]PZW97854.1 hypothetical protein C7439_10762 [Lachnoanaerobaculum umeaense]